MNNEISTSPKYQYTDRPPELIGKFLLSLEESRSLPLDLNEIYAVANEAVDSNYERAVGWAKTYGALNVRVALDDSPTLFGFESAEKKQNTKNSSEISTLAQFTLGEQFVVEEEDSPVVYLLAENGKPIATELALIQALHMLDTALISGQYAGRQLVKLADAESLNELKLKYPEAVLRQYGNVRGIDGAPSLLGAVVSVSALEKSKIEMTSLPDNRVAPAEPEQKINIPAIKEEATFVGITTAKRPHFGHACLCAKAISEEKTVVIELNDQGPRVDQALVELAKKEGLGVDEVSELVSRGFYSMGAIEDAYKNRDTTATSPTIPEYSLTGPNNYYKDLFAQVKPPNVDFVMSANSDLGKETAKLKENPDYIALLADSGMGVIANQSGSAVLVESGGKPTVAGILASLAVSRNLKLIDSPPPITSKERKVLSTSGLSLDQKSGCGVMINFGVESGTNGATVLIETLVEKLNARNLDALLLFPVVRQMMNSTCAFPGEPGSICPNFASKEAVLNKFERAIDEVRSMCDPYVVLEKPIEYRNIIKPALREVTAGTYSDIEPRGKITLKEVQSLIGNLPGFADRLSKELQDYLTDGQIDADSNIPRNYLSDVDRSLVTMIRGANPQRFTELLADLAEEDEKFSELLFEQMMLGKEAQEMGYTIDMFPGVLRKISTQKGLYKPI